MSELKTNLLIEALQGCSFVLKLLVIKVEQLDEDTAVEIAKLLTYVDHRRAKLGPHS